MLVSVASHLVDSSADLLIEPCRACALLISSRSVSLEILKDSAWKASALGHCLRFFVTADMPLLCLIGLLNYV